MKTMRLKRRFALLSICFMRLKLMVQANSCQQLVSVVVRVARCLIRVTAGSRRPLRGQARSWFLACGGLSTKSLR